MMSTSAVTVSAITRLAAPLVKDLYDGAKGGLKSAFNKWSASGYPRKIASRISEIDSVRTIWSPEENVSVRGFYHPCSVSTLNGEVIQINHISDLGGENFVIQGIVGQGKSIFLRYLALQEILKDKGGRLPLFIELRKITKEKPLLSVIKDSLKAYHIDVDDLVLEYLFSSGKMVLILDGFDEITSGLAIAAATDIDGLVLRHPELQVIVSSRLGNEIQKLTSFRIVSITPLSSSDFAPFLKSLKLKALRVVELVQAIGESPSDIAGLITTPLMLTLVAFVYQSEKEIPAELPDFFEKLFYTVFTRHDKLKPNFSRQHFSGLSERKLQQLFEAFCFMCLQMGLNRTISAQGFQEAFELAYEYASVGECNESGFRRDITQVSCLMLEEGWGDATFLHKSIAEYYAAAFVKNADDTFAIRFYTEAAKDHRKWQECLNFLGSIDPFRFSKYFALPELEKILPVVKALRGVSTSRELNKTLPSIMSKARVNYRQAEPKDLRDLGYPVGAFVMSSIGPIGASKNFYDAHLSNALTDVIFKHAPAHLSESQAKSLMSEFRYVEKASHDDFSLDMGGLLVNSCFDRFLSAMQGLEGELEMTFFEAQKLAEKMEKRSLIFDKKIKT